MQGISVLKRVEKTMGGEISLSLPKRTIPPRPFAKEPIPSEAIGEMAALVQEHLDEIPLRGLSNVLVALAYLVPSTGSVWGMFFLVFLKHRLIVQSRRSLQQLLLFSPIFGFPGTFDLTDGFL